jgi:hypothetical protein
MHQGEHCKQIEVHRIVCRVVDKRKSKAKKKFLALHINQYVPTASLGE